MFKEPEDCKRDVAVALARCFLFLAGKYRSASCYQLLQIAACKV